MFISIINEQSTGNRLRHFSDNNPLSKIDFSELLSSAERELIQNNADSILNRRLDLLGSGRIFFGEKLDWHSDFVTGFRWDSSRLYGEMSSLTPPGSDIKRPWKLSCCHHFVTLGLAWRLFEKENYRNEFISEIEDWISRNPVGYGVNWACPMEVAIRSVNWLVGYVLFCPGISGSEYASFCKILTASLWDHGRFLETHLEWNGPFSERRANHFLANLTGLFTLGVFFSDLRSGQRWLSFAKKWLEKEMQRQVLNDGVHFECSTSYHRLCLEMFMWCKHLGMSHDILFSWEYKQKIRKMKFFSRAYTRADGLAPLFGDNDDGRLLSSGLNDINDHVYLFDCARTGVSSLEANLFAGDNRSAIEDAADFSGFYSSGFYILRSPDAYLIVRAGRLGYIGTHAHCDQLSFELCLKGLPVFVDRGTYVYSSDPDLRKLYRSTQAHNVLSVNGAEQNRAQTRAGGKIYGLMDDTQTRVIEASKAEIKARHTGFKTLMRDDIAHTRSFRFSEMDRMLEIIDEIDGIRVNDSVEWFFHLAPGFDIEIQKHEVTLKYGNFYLCKLEFPERMDVHKKRFDHSPSYGCMQKAESLVFGMKLYEADLPCKVGFKVFWRE